MEQYDYDVTRLGPDFFETMVYYCTPQGDCETERVPTKKAELLLGLFNDRGREGWELIQLLPGESGILAFWKRRIVA